MTWSALRAPPWRLLRSAVPWRALAYLATGILPGAATTVLLPPLVATLVGPVLLARGLAAVERWRLRLVDDRPAPRPRRAVWAELAFMLVTAILLWTVDLMVVAATVGFVVLPILAPLLVLVLPAHALPNAERLGAGVWLLPLAGLGFLVLAGYLVTAVALARASLVRAILAPQSEELVELTRAGGRLLAGFDSQRRRIERDLHDGVQQRLLTLSVNLGLARTMLDDRGDDLAHLVVAAHEDSKAVLEHLRDIVNGIHPWLLTDRGLGPAVVELAGRIGVPVRVDVDPEVRYPAEVEVTAFYVVSEALTNVDKHSGAGEVTVSAVHHKGRLIVEVRDDGRGGADPGHGTGLQGLADRAAAAGARLLIASPVGGPTVLRLEIPCG